MYRPDASHQALKALHIPRHLMLRVPGCLKGQVLSREAKESVQSHSRVDGGGGEGPWPGWSAQ